MINMTKRLFKKYVKNIDKVIEDDYHYICCRFREITEIRHAVVSQAKSMVK